MFSKEPVYKFARTNSAILYRNISLDNFALQANEHFGLIFALVENNAAYNTFDDRDVKLVRKSSFRGPKINQNTKVSLHSSEALTDEFSNIQLEFPFSVL